MTAEPEVPNEQDAGTQPPDLGKAGEPADERTFTQAELDKVIKERLERERKKAAEKFADYEALKDKAAQFDKIEESQKTELQKANEQLEALQQRTQQAEAEAKRVKYESSVINAAMQMNFADPKDALAMIGEVENVEEALGKLVESKPYLLKTDKPKPPGGYKPVNPLLKTETDDERRRRLGLG